MPLTIQTEYGNPGAATAIFWTGFHRTPKYIGHAGMGEFWTSQNAPAETALSTSGAGPCQIIVVHKANGTGALGHYAGTPITDDILQGVQDMIQALGGGPIDTVVFAAGVIYDSPSTQLMYEMRIIAGTRSLAPGAQVKWPRQHPGNNWGSAVYLPQSAQLALFTMFDRNILGRYENGNGLTSHGY